MKLILRKKFVLIKTFWGTSVSDPVWLGLLPLPPNPRVLERQADRRKESPGTSLAHQCSAPASGSSFERPARACGAERGHRTIPSLLHICQDTTVPSISGLLMFEGSEFVKQPIGLCGPWENATPWGVIVLPFSSSKLTHSY